MTGTWTLVRVALRRDRIMLPAWVYGIALLVLSTAASFRSLYPTPESRVGFAASIRASGALRALTGPAYGLDTVGGLTAWRSVGLASVVAGLMGLLLVVRHTRADEEAGRTELVGAGVVGRYAVLASGLLVALIGAVSVAVLLVAGLVALGLPLAGSVATGLAVASAVLVFAAAAALTAQIGASARAAAGSAGALLGAAYVLRAAGDASTGTLSWLSPIGWAQAVRPYAGQRWAVLLLPAVLAVALAAGAAALVPRRDVGAGLLPSRLGPPDAAPGLRSPWALACRLQRGTLLGWTVGYLLAGIAVGTVAADTADLVGDNSGITDIVRRLGGAGDIVDSYLASVLGLMGLVAAGYAVAATLRLRTEETEQRAEPVLATGVSRTRWALAHVLVAALGTGWLLLVGGTALGLVHGLRVHDVAGELGAITAAALAQVPAAWVLGGLAVLVTGVAPRLVALGWVAVGLCLGLGQIGELLELPGWLLDLSPFRHVPQLPVDSAPVRPLVLLLALALALALGGLSGLRRRDIG
ncbi:MAG TPA: ABC transporter permease [Mycobacteriales bacterium]